MKAKISADVIQEALKICLRLASPVSGNVTLQANGKSLIMSSASEIARCAVLLPGDVSGEAFFAIGSNNLRDAIKGRDELEIVYDKTMLNIQSGRYHSSLATVDALPIEETEDEKGKVWKLNADQASWLKSAVATVSLKPTADITAYMPLSVRLNSKSAFVACYDTYHMAFITDKQITGELDLTLPLDTFSSILEVFSKINFTLTVTRSQLIVKNKLVKVFLSLPETEDSSITTDQVFDKAKEASKADGSEIELSKQDVMIFLENARAVAAKERSEISIATDTSGKVQLQVTTNGGTSKTVLKARVGKKLSFKVNYEYLLEAINKCADTVLMKVMNDMSFISIKTSTAYVFVSLNQDD